MLVAILLATSLFPARALAVATHPAIESDTVRIAAVSDKGNNQYVLDGVVYRAETNEAGSVVAVGFDNADEGGSGADAASEDAAAADPATAPMRTVTIPDAISTVKGECPVVGVAFDAGQVAEGVTVLNIGAAVEGVATDTLGRALPSLVSVSVDPANAAYSSHQGMLLKGSELAYAPAATVAASVPVGCETVASGAFRDAAGLKTVVVRGAVESVAGAADPETGASRLPAFSDEQLKSVRVALSPVSEGVAAPEGGARVVATVSLESSGDADRASAWRDCGIDGANIVEGATAGASAGIADSGLSCTMLANGTLSVGWAGDKAAVPAAVELPASAEIDGTTYAVGEVAAEAFKDAAALESVKVAEGTTAIGESAFENCANLKEASLPSTLKTIDYAAFRNTGVAADIVPEGVSAVGGDAFSSASPEENAEVVQPDAALEAYATEGELPPGGEPAAEPEPFDPEASEAAATDTAISYYSGAAVSVTVPVSMTFGGTNGYDGSQTSFTSTSYFKNTSTTTSARLDSVSVTDSGMATLFPGLGSTSNIFSLAVADGSTRSFGKNGFTGGAGPGFSMGANGTLDYSLTLNLSGVRVNTGVTTASDGTYTFGKMVFAFAGETKSGDFYLTDKRSDNGGTYTVDEVKAHSKDIAQRGQSSVWWGMYHAFATEGATYGYEVPKSYECKVNYGGTMYDLRIIGLNQDRSSSGSVLGLTFQFVDLLADKHNMNDAADNTGGWGSSAMKTYLNDTVLKSLPTTVQNALTAARKYYGAVYNSEDATVAHSDDKIFLCSHREVVPSVYSGFSSYAWMDNEGTGAGHNEQYLFYQDKSVNSGGSNNILQKKLKGASSASTWWLRSCNPAGSSRFCCVGAGGSPSSYTSASSALGVAPCFCL